MDQANGRKCKKTRTAAPKVSGTDSPESEQKKKSENIVTSVHPGSAEDVSSTVMSNLPRHAVSPAWRLASASVSNRLERTHRIESHPANFDCGKWKLHLFVPPWQWVLEVFTSIKKHRAQQTSTSTCAGGERSRRTRGRGKEELAARRKLTRAKESVDHLARADTAEDVLDMRAIITGLGATKTAPPWSVSKPLEPTTVPDVSYVRL